MAPKLTDERIRERVAYLHRVRRYQQSAGLRKAIRLAFAEAEGRTLEGRGPKVPAPRHGAREPRTFEGRLYGRR